MRKTLTLLALGAMLGLLVTYGAVSFFDRVIWLPHRTGTPTDTVLDFSPRTSVQLERSHPDGARPRNIILVVGDGLGFSHLLAARTKRGSINEPLFVERLPVRSWQTVQAHNSIYTDSASTATAMATGHKVAPGDLAVIASGNALLTVAEAAKKKGLAVGLVTDSYLWDATPGAFAAHVNRGLYGEVGSAMARSGFDMLVGGVKADHPGASDDELISEFRARGYSISRSFPSLELAELPVLGLLPEGVIADPESVGLLDIAELTLTRLANIAGEGFFLLLETEEVDSASHRHQDDRVINGVLTFDALVELAVEFARTNGETLVVAASDHETGGLMLLNGLAGEPLRIRWGTTRHTAHPVPIFAFGPGAEGFATVIDNTDTGKLLFDQLELDHR